MKKFIRRVLGAVAALALTVSFSGCGVQLLQQPEIIIGCDECRPYIYTDEEGKAAGIDVDLAQEAFRRLGYTPVFKKIEWNDRDALLERGEIDCLWSCYSMDGREELYDWVGPYMYARQVVAVLDSSLMRSIGDLEGKSVAVRASSLAESLFLGYNGNTMPSLRRVYSLTDVDEMVAALRNDYVDAIAGYNATITELLTNAQVSYRTLSEDLDRAALGVAFAPGENSRLSAELSEVLVQMAEDGTMEQILARYGIDADKAMGRS